MSISAYTKTTYVNDTTPAINATNLNNIEQQVKDVSDFILEEPFHTPSTTGLLCAPDFSIPEYPDSAAGTTYFNGNFTAADGWTAVDCTLSYSGGKMILTATGSNPRVQRAVTASTTVRYKARKISGNGTASGVRNTTGTIYNITKQHNTDGTILIDGFIGAGATGSLNIEPGNNETTVGAQYEISFIYIGDGTYTSKAYDASGNGVHFTVTGATPTHGSNGRALIFDGVNDKIESPSLGQSNAMSFYWRGTPTSATTSSVIFAWWESNVSGLVMRGNGAGGVRLGFARSGATETTDVSSIFANTTDIVELILVVNNSSKTWTLYKNGISAGSGTLTNAWVLSTNRTIEMGSATGLTSWTGTVDAFYPFNRALSADEVYQLYVNKGVNVNNLVKAQTPVPSSLVVRDSSGNVEASGIKFPATQVASSDPNTLDDYEEGTFTPGVSFGGGTTGITYSAQIGRYTKTGNRIFFNLNLILSNIGSSTGDALVTGLPFPSVNQAGLRISMAYRITVGTYTGTPVCVLIENSSNITIGNVSEAGAYTAASNSNFTNTTGIVISGHYYV